MAVHLKISKISAGRELGACYHSMRRVERSRAVGALSEGWSPLPVLVTELCSSGSQH